MKKTIILSFLSGVLLTLTYAFTNNNSGEQDKTLGKINLVDGKPVFVNCAPVVPYETAFEFVTKAHSFGGCPTVDDFCKESVKSANKKGFPYDAIILGNTKYDLAIKFK